jgi:hypothetical protein
MHASPGREVQSDLLSVAPLGAELAGPQAQDAGGQDLGDLGEAGGGGQLSIGGIGHGSARRRRGELLPHTGSVAIPSDDRTCASRDRALSAIAHSFCSVLWGLPGPWGPKRGLCVMRFAGGASDEGPSLEFWENRLEQPVQRLVEDARAPGSIPPRRLRA